MSNFLSRRFQNMCPYAPGEQPRGMEYIKLNTNESPFPPSEKVINALSSREVEKLRLYSDPLSKLSTEAIAEFYKIKPTQVLVTNGSDEALAFIYTAFCDNEKEVVVPEISYGFYPVFCELLGLKYNFIPLKSDFKVDVEAFCNLNKNIVIANPNAPTGIAISIEDIRKIALTNPVNVVVIDEAYVDFGAESAVGLLAELNNLIIVQTFSKSRSLAGARLGMILASEEIIEDLNKIKFSFNPYNVNRLTDIAGCEAIKDVAYFNICAGEIIQNRDYLTNGLISLGFEVLPSKANFIFVRREGISGKLLYLSLKEKGILVRHFDNAKIEEFVRISIGTKSQMDTLLKRIAEILQKEKLI